jgi:hypothetical protein
MNANILHPTLQKAQVETAFDDGRPADAVRDTFGEAERHVHALAGGADCSPAALMHAAFAPATGRSSDPAVGVGARRATQPMFVVPPVKYRTAAEHAAAAEDQLEAVEGVLLADLLARKLAGVAQGLGSTPPDVP